VIILNEELRFAQSGKRGKCLEIGLTAMAIMTTFLLIGLTTIRGTTQKIADGSILIRNPGISVTMLWLQLTERLTFYLIGAKYLD
jgi:hypothetical protein